MKGITLFDNYEEDGQLSLFNADYDDWDENWVENEEEIESEQADGEVPDAGSAASSSDVNTEEDGEFLDSDDINSTGATAKSKPKARVSAKAGSSAAGNTVAMAGAAATTGSAAGGGVTSGGEVTGSGPEIRVKYCASCGKLLFVKEETAGFHSECNNCGIKYFQKL